MATDRDMPPGGLAWAARMRLGVCWPLPPPFAHLHESGYLFLILGVNQIFRLPSSVPAVRPGHPRAVISHPPTPTCTHLLSASFVAPLLFIVRFLLHVNGDDQLTLTCRWPYSPMQRRRTHHVPDATSGLKLHAQGPGLCALPRARKTKRMVSALDKRLAITICFTALIVNSMTW